MSKRNRQSTSETIKVPSETAKIFVELARMSQESFFNRRSYEWKVAFGLWTAIGLFTYYAAVNPKLLFSHFPCYLAFLYLGVLFAWHFLWQVPMRIAFEHDQTFKHYYMHKAEGRPVDWPLNTEAANALATSKDVYQGASLPYTFAQSTITLFFLLLSWLVIISAMSSSASIETREERCHVSLRGKANRHSQKKTMAYPHIPLNSYLNHR